MHRDHKQKVILEYSKIVRKINDFCFLTTFINLLTAYEGTT